MAVEEREKIEQAHKKLIKKGGWVNIFGLSLEALSEMEKDGNAIKSCAFSLLAFISNNNNILKCGNNYLNISNFSEFLDKDQSNMSKVFKKLIQYGVICKTQISKICENSKETNQIYIYNPYIARPSGTVNECVYQLFDNTAFINQESKAYKSKHEKSYERSIANGIRYDVLSRDNFTCQICGRTIADGVKLEVDHKIPVSKGGKSTMDNLWTLCFDCNRGKYNKAL